jgi:starvation-inducible DNA-binding protein
MDSHLTFAAPDRELLFVSLSRLLDETYTHLADTRALYVSTHALTGANDALSQAVRAVFERHYTELAVTVDLIIKRMRELGLTGAPAPSRSSMITRPFSNMGEMAERLLDRHETLVATAQTLLPALSRMNDGPTAALLATRLQVHAHTASELRGLLYASDSEEAESLRAMG